MSTNFFWFLLLLLSCVPHSEEDGEQEDKTIWYYSTKVNATHVPLRGLYTPNTLHCNYFILKDIFVNINVKLPVFSGVSAAVSPSSSCVALLDLLPNSVLQVQLAELIDCLDKEYWEADLYAALEEIRDEVHAHMDVTEDLTNKARGSNKCFLTAANGKKSSTLSQFI